jgi:hypothetical protein
MDNFFIDVVLYDKEGKAYELRRFKTKRVGNKDVLDSAGKPVKVISSISVVDEKENPSRVYTFDDGGALKTVSEVPHHKFWADHTDYTVDSSGTAVSKKVWNEKGELVGEFKLPADKRPRFALSQDRLTVPPGKLRSCSASMTPRSIWSNPASTKTELSAQSFELKQPKN